MIFVSLIFAVERDGDLKNISFASFSTFSVFYI